MQVQTGIASHRRRFGDWAGGFWLPECGYAPWLDPRLEEAGVRSSCAELTNLFGLPTYSEPEEFSDFDRTDSQPASPVSEEFSDFLQFVHRLRIGARVGHAT